MGRPGVSSESYWTAPRIASRCMPGFWTRSNLLRLKPAKAAEKAIVRLSARAVFRSRSVDVRDLERLLPQRKDVCSGMFHLTVPKH